ncbi:TonB-dependent receptor [Algibacter lectus]|uniref:Outer membrane receptor protein involved in Fe transport n=1 Tax=Algibacter lectus TaxID=221126 RepID=A0A4R8MGZ0_9FLAO|nr:TonB-dependent receptor plug domain-containing protein [Algibacter lectus]MWW24775.1 TonB-dependent receptor plug domain-containing protein [Algibacter lectus]TDY64814.1 outer membrane receptor protein involved in Fe transport [Algibacter lectus]
MNYRKYFSTFLVLFLVNLGFSQRLKGVIIDENNQPLEAAYVYNLNSETHAHSSANGMFVLDENKIGDSLKVGLLGYKNQVLVLEEKVLNSGITITLQEKTFQLEELHLNEQLNALSTISRLDLSIDPVNSSQEVLRKVPGLIIGQHAGGGKAEQLFLRGFDIDHGTDVAISVDGMPVNMVSHAHGQGYSDLHFLIAETVNKIDFGKGSYYANKGDFNTAGYVDFSTKDYIKDSQVSLSIGQFNSLRTLGMFDLLGDSKNENAYMAIEYLENDGPFESPQNFNRLNLFGKYTVISPQNNKLSLTLSHFKSRWDASGQIPQREVDNGNISRFGAIDDTEGGNTQRTNLNIEYSKYINDDTRLKTNMLYTHSAFELYSNFTFFLEDPVNGDQIKQTENRDIFGFNSRLIHDTYLGETPVVLSAGVSLRNDVANDTELSKTLNRSTTLEQVQLGDINQTNASMFVNAEFEFGKLVVAPALRLEHFKFMYNDKLQTNYTALDETKTALLPKLNFFYNAKDNLQLYLKSGIGFHSNDTRVVVTNASENVLPKAYGVDFGNIWKPTPKLVVNSALWYLFLEQEFVYVGDAGIVEPSGRTRRYGADLGVRYQLNNWLFLNTDATLTKARSIDEASGEDYIPLAPDFTLTGGLAVNDLKGFSGGLNFRYIDDRPANEDNSIIAEGYFVSDFNVNYTINNLTFGFAIENLFDTEWNETQFATTSRLQNETAPVEEIHFTPGTPFSSKFTVSYRF